MKRQPIEWEKIFAIDATDEGLISKIYNREKTVSSVSGAGKIICNSYM